MFVPPRDPLPGAKPAPVDNKNKNEPKVRPATPDLNMTNILEISGKDNEDYAQLLLNDIGGRELSTISRTNSINGVNVIYQPITDLSMVVLRNNSLNISPNPNSQTDHFDVVSLDLDEYTPTQKELSDEGFTSVVYFNKDDGSLRINVKDIGNELVEIEFIKIQSINDATMYYGDTLSYSS